MRARIAPSLLSADQTDLRGAVDAIHAAGCDLVHLDVMDGHYVPNLSFGTKVALDLAAYIADRGYALGLDIHLMVTDPDALIPLFAKAHPRYLTIHIEAPIHPHRSLQLIRERGIAPGISLNPATPLVAIEEVIEEIDLILLMTVNPGFGGQSFIPGGLDKIRRCRELLSDRGASALIEVDGGVKADNIARIVAAGADLCVAGSAVFKLAEGATIAGNIAGLRAALATAPASS